MKTPTSRWQHTLLIGSILLIVVALGAAVFGWMAGRSGELSMDGTER